MRTVGMRWGWATGLVLALAGCDPKETGPVAGKAAQVVQVTLAAKPLRHFLGIPEQRLAGARQPVPLCERGGGRRAGPSLDRETAANG